MKDELLQNSAIRCIYCSYKIFLVHCRSASHPDIPVEGNGTVRVSDYFSDMVIKAQSSIYEPGMDFELSYFDNPQMHIPASCVNWVASTGKSFFFM